MSHHNKKLYEAVFENRPIMKCDLQLLVVEIRQVLEGYSNVTCRKSSDDNESMQRINTSLILENIEVLKMIFSKEIYKEHSIRLFEEEIASLLLILLEVSDNKFVTFCCSNCLQNILQNPVYAKQSRAILKGLCDILAKTSCSIAVRTSAMKVVGKSLEKMDVFDKDLGYYACQILERNWKLFVSEFLHAGLDNSEQYSVSVFLLLWKKVIRYMCKRHVDSDNLSKLELWKSLSTLLGSVDIIPSHCCCKAVSVLLTSFREQLNKDVQNQENSDRSANASQFLQMLVDEKLQFLLYAFIPGGFLGAANVTITCCDDQKLVQKSTLLCLCCSFEVLSTGTHSKERILVIKCLHQLKKRLKEPFFKTSLKLFDDQDDHMVNTLYYFLHIYQKLMDNSCSEKIKENASQVSFDLEEINPHIYFVQLLSTVNWDYSLVLDWVISPETNFLQYFMDYLKYTVSDWFGLLQKCTEFFTIDFTNAVGDEYPQKGEKNSSLLQKGLEFKKQNSNSLEDVTIPCTTRNNTLKPLVNYSDSESEKSEDEIDPMAQCNNDNSKIQIDDGEKIYLTMMCKQPLESGSREERDEDQGLMVHTGHLNKTELEIDVIDDNDKTHVNDILDKYMAVLIRLGLKIERMEEQGIFPFRVKPLLYLINKCEELYECNPDEKL